MSESLYGDPQPFEEWSTRRCKLHVKHEATAPAAVPICVHRTIPIVTAAQEVKEECVRNPKLPDGLLFMGRKAEEDEPLVKIHVTESGIKIFFTFIEPFPLLPILFLNFRQRRNTITRLLSFEVKLICLLSLERQPSVATSPIP